MTSTSRGGATPEEAPSALESCWQCPDCGYHDLKKTARELQCPQCDARYPLVEGIPVLIRVGNALFRPDAYVRRRERAKRASSLRKLVPSPSVNLARDRVLSRFDELLEGTQGPVLLVGSGNQARSVREALSLGGALIAIDVSPDASVDAWADAHDLPVRDDTVSGVIVTAVLEHVLAPERVVAEIARVLEPGGVVYSEIPFMQQVHEGALDFTRVTAQGHRYLFKNFRELESGMVAGPATSLVWAIEHFAGSVPSGDRAALYARGFARLMSFWIKYADHLLAKRPRALDAASCTYFMGRKDPGFVLSEAELIDSYSAVAKRHSEKSA
jgi:SAM-dependent methyltransferase